MAELLQDYYEECNQDALQTEERIVLLNTKEIGMILVGLNLLEKNNNQDPHLADSNYLIELINELQLIRGI